MRFSSSVFLALPLAAFAAEEGAFGQYKAQFQNFLGSFGAKQAADQDQVAEERKQQYQVEEVPVEGTALSALTLENWQETLYGALPEGATTPEEWWVFVTGRNKTCRGKFPGLLSPRIAVRIKFANGTRRILRQGRGRLQRDGRFVRRHDRDSDAQHGPAQLRG